ncbi:MAG: hypothetical protein J7M30_07150 [Deltaproteobacteria bacterium]|nr:hypothetical protein [Deltaproteobacteria bacterium]
MIKARIEAESSEANLRSYDETYKMFIPSDVEKEFSWHRTGKINIVHEAVDRWAMDPQKKGQKALIFEKTGK